MNHDCCVCEISLVMQKQEQLEQKVDELEKEINHEKEQMQTILTQSMQLIQQTEAAQKSAQAPGPTPEPAPAAPLPEKASLTFDLDSSLISDTMRETLAPLAQSLIDRPDLIAQVRGYTDSLGDKKYNAQLAQVRAEAVMDALIDLGAPAIQLKTLSFGESQSSQKSTPNDRRVELVFRYR